MKLADCIQLNYCATTCDELQIENFWLCFLSWCFCLKERLCLSSSLSSKFKIWKFCVIQILRLSRVLKSTWRIGFISDFSSWFNKWDDFFLTYPRYVWKLLFLTILNYQLKTVFWFYTHYFCQILTFSCVISNT